MVACPSTMSISHQPLAIRDVFKNASLPWRGSGHADYDCRDHEDTMDTKPHEE